MHSVSSQLLRPFKVKEFSHHCRAVSTTWLSVSNKPGGLPSHLSSMEKNRPFLIKSPTWERTGESSNLILKSKSRGFMTRWLMTQPGIIKWVRGRKISSKVITLPSEDFGRTNKLKASLSNSYEIWIYALYLFRSNRF